MGVRFNKSNVLLYYDIEGELEIVRHIVKIEGSHNADWL